MDSYRTMKNFYLKLGFCFVLMIAAAAFAYSQPRLVPNKIMLKTGKTFTLNLPQEFEIIPAVEGLKRVRFFAKAPDGRIFVTDMLNLSDNHRGTVYILDGWDPAKGKFARVIPYMTNLRNPNSVAFWRDADGQDWLYLAETDKLTRRKFTRGETRPGDPNPQVLATFPDYGLSYKYGGWHLTRTIAFTPAGKLYISVGSSCNACREKEKVRASVIEMNPDGTAQREFARGLRNAVGLKYMANNLWASGQGSDHLGLQKPDETFYALRDGTDYGWPFCYASGGKVFADPQFPRSDQCKNVAAPYAYFPAHASALGFDYWDEPDAPDTIKNSFLVALHGSTNKSIGHGYKIVIMRRGDKPADFIDGFLQGNTVVGRPCDIMKIDASSFLFTDDYSGIIYFVRKKGAVTKLADDESVPASDDTAANGINADSPNVGSKTCLSVVLLLGASFIRSLI
jgi:glucose/arabinose dehydrogenase